MKYCFLFFTLLVVFGNCNLDSNSKTNTELDFTKQVKHPRFMVATRPGAYYPKNLRKLSVIEMREVLVNRTEEFNWVSKDEKGNVVSNDYYLKGPNPRLIQMYVNENDVVIECVIMETSPEILAIMTMLRFVTYQ
ncbi:MAG: hypothetical protein IPI50_08295 [Saprospiraceae bacterium]|nr:hypothetical protein [Saprospiraceae bacterium]